MRAPINATLPPSPSSFPAPLVLGAPSPPPPRPEGDTLPEIRIAPTVSPGEGRRSSGGGDRPPASGLRTRRHNTHRHTAWVGSSSTGADFVVLLDRGTVVRVWMASDMARFGTVDEAIKASGEVRIKVVVDGSTAAGRMLATAIRDRLGSFVEEALPDRPSMAELRAVIDQGMVVYHIDELAKAARVSRANAVRAAGVLGPALEEMQRPLERSESIPQMPRPRWWPAAMWGLRILGVLLCVAGGAFAVSQFSTCASRVHLSIGR